jgi:O-succinylbenzoic acid--CoA ligase
MTASHTTDGNVAAQKLVAVTITPGVGGVTRLQSRLSAALDGTGPAIVPVPDGPSQVVHDIQESIKPDDDEFPLELHDVALVCATSGSTGTPRGTLLTHSALQASAVAFGKRFGTNSRWVLAMPAHRIAGLMVLVRAHFHNSPVIVDPSIGGARQFSAATFSATTSQAVRASHIDGRQLFVSLVPTQIARLIESGSVGIEALQAYDVVLSGAASTPQPLLDTLRQHGINVVVSYGMSETCGGCVFDGMPLDGVQVSIASDDDAQPGRISISGPVIASGYRLRPDLDSLTFINNRVVTQDVGALDSAGFIHILGRLDDIVTVGGVNVALSAVESAIRHHHMIKDVAVIDIADPLWGSLPLAYVVLRQPESTTEQGLLTLTRGIQTTVANRIGRAATPRTINFVEYLPMLDSGKVDRLTLRLQASRDIEQGRTQHPGSV